MQQVQMLACVLRSAECVSAGRTGKNGETVAMSRAEIHASLLSYLSFLRDRYAGIMNNEVCRED